MLKVNGPIFLQITVTVFIPDGNFVRLITAFIIQQILKSFSCLRAPPAQHMRPPLHLFVYFRRCLLELRAHRNEIRAMIEDRSYGNQWPIEKWVSQSWPHILHSQS